MSTRSNLNNSEDHKFTPRQSSDSRSPCPALNALANHGYIPHTGKDFTFIQLIKAMVLVYSISYPLAFFLASAGFLTCGELSVHSYQGLSAKHQKGPAQDHEANGPRLTALFWHFFNSAKSIAIYILQRPIWTLDLEALSERGYVMIAHDGSFVHSDGKPSTAPDPTRVESLIHRASTARDASGHLKGGLDFTDIIRIRTENALSARPLLNKLHEQVSFGECGLLWEVLRDHPPHEQAATLEGVIPTHRLQQWLCEERLPDGWWDSRPKKTVGLWQARTMANAAARLSKQIAEEAGVRELAKSDAIAID